MRVSDFWVHMPFVSHARRSHAEMRAGVAKDLMAMKVADQLKDELEARGEARSGNKAWLRRRLHAAIVRKYLPGGRRSGRGGLVQL